MPSDKYKPIDVDTADEIELMRYNKMLKRSKVKFRKSYDVDPATGCWIWLGRRSSEVTGNIPIISFNYQEVAAHRFAFEHIADNRLIPGRHLKRVCDNPDCVNPDHIARV